MKLFDKKVNFVIIALIFLACFIDDTEARRRVLRGRRTITRTYYRQLVIPGWAIIILVALAEILVGAILYFITRKFVLSTTIETSNTYVPANTNSV